ncbi:enterotoxin A family protein [Yersinia aleksiciae]|uniref:Heat-labile enterotoxin IIB, A chain n=1 Tax=Yersinia aleksiciae TaxID=263819 RepID=A0A0T9TWM9_YERAE|nr:enterotoxin A family protein [Yersinia aleksiciae]CNL06038.1 Heat-labile enterotoxin IIB%2C A chain precursor [Yersinia aleksiciae]
MLNIKSLHFIFILSINYPAFAINQVNLVYRADSRAPEEITLAGGMFPFSDLPQDPDLLHHFEGESLEGYTSAFVSTTASLRQAINHAAFTARMSDAEPFDPEFETYLYIIRPSENFYSIDTSFNHAREELTENSLLYAKLRNLLRDYGGMEEWVALGGFTNTRIISYARLSGPMLQQHYYSGQIFSELFWAGRWQNNPQYSSALDSEHSTSAPYLALGVPRGYVTMAQNGSGQQLPLSITCYGDASYNTSRMKREVFKNNCQREKVHTSRYFYNKKPLWKLFN